MTDFAKRRTLKGLAAAAAGTATTGFATYSQASTDNGLIPTTPNDTEGHLAIYTRMSATGNDIEAVFVNAGTDTLTIATLTPHEITTFRGTFDVAALTKTKPLVLEPGELVTVSMAPHNDKMAWRELMQQGQSLSRALQASATAATTNGIPIHISVNESLPFA